MSQKLNQIVFFGSGPVAARSLQSLAEWLDIKLVVTKNKPEHHKETPPVQVVAEQYDLDIAFANNKKEVDIALNVNQPIASLGVVIDYGVIISKNAIDYFEDGIINSHFSLLPEWRGADPISFALLSGQKSTGISIMLIDEGLDTGRLLMQKDLIINKEHNGPSLTNDLINLSNISLKNIIPNYLDKTIKPYDQDLSYPVTYSTMLSKNDGVIDITKNAYQIEREIKAFIEWPKSRLVINNIDVIITKARAINLIAPQQPYLIKDNDIFVSCKNSTLQLIELQPAGKKPMQAKDFINGYLKNLI